MFASGAKALPRTAQWLSRSIAERESPSLSRKERDHVGKCLRAMYGQLREAPLPPRLQDLVHRLAQSPSD